MTISLITCKQNFSLVVSKFLEPFIVLRFLFQRTGCDRRYHLTMDLIDGILMKTLYPNSARLFEYSLAFSFDRDASASAKEEPKESDSKKKGKNKGKGQGTYKGTSISSYRKLLFDKLRELVRKPNDSSKKGGEEQRYLGVPKHLIGTGYSTSMKLTTLSFSLP